MILKKNIYITSYKIQVKVVQLFNSLLPRFGVFHNIYREIEL